MLWINYSYLLYTSADATQLLFYCYGNDPETRISDCELSFSNPVYSPLVLCFPFFQQLVCEHNKPLVQTTLVHRSIMRCLVAVITVILVLRVEGERDADVCDKVDRDFQECQDK